VLGAGFVGTEVASTAGELGVSVTLVDPSPPLARVLGDQVSQLLVDRYLQHGIDLRIGVALGAVRVESNRVRGITLTDGAFVACDALLVAVGAEPAVLPGFAGEGIRTDEQGRTEHEGVYACGDVACPWHPTLGRHLRVEHWTDAAAQGAAVAGAILGEEPGARELPFFWSDQFGLRLQYVGHASAWSSVQLDGDSDGFSALYLDRDSRPLAALLANRPRELGPLRRELAGALSRAA
jgi:NADPH-dependent 2,4-dienoyl-CoA reductase/sulfur reductase-like enzyme